MDEHTQSESSIFDIRVVDMAGSINPVASEPHDPPEMNEFGFSKQVSNTFLVGAFVLSFDVLSLSL